MFREWRISQHKAHLIFHLRSIIKRLVVFALLLQVPACLAETTDGLSGWTIYITNDNCPDYTWGYPEHQTRESFADIVRAHLDEMNRTDELQSDDRDCYNMAVTQEALCFIEYYPQRKEELIRRIKEGRLFISPYLCNSLWAFQSFESAIRTFYPARRLERNWGISIDVAEHIEQPCLPWGVAPILAGCGIRWLSVPFYGYDSTFSGLNNPPLFILEGPDGSKVRVILDRWASSKASYMQAGHILRNPDSIAKEWVPHYRNLGEVYPLKVILASGTHGDISPHSGSQAHGFAEAIIKYNTQSGSHPKLVNSTLPQFCEAVDKVQAKKPFLQTIRGCFGHSWDVWPVSLAKYVADMREGERRFLAAETLLSAAAYFKPELHDATRSQRERAEWCLSMLADHAWNGTNEENKRHNAELRRKWSQELNRLSQGLLQLGWSGIGLETSTKHISIFNSLSFPRMDLVRIETPSNVCSVLYKGKNINSQIVKEHGKQVVYFLSPRIPGFGLARLDLISQAKTDTRTNRLFAAPTLLESDYYRLEVDCATGGIASLIHKATGSELVVPNMRRSLCQSVYFIDGKNYILENVKSEVVAHGPVLARLKIVGTFQNIKVINFVTLYAELDRVDFDIHINKPVTSKQQCLYHVFPVLAKEAMLRVETTGAVLRPQPQPRGDLLPGADTRRFAIQGFVDVFLADGVGMTIAPLDAFVLRLDRDPISFEALGNDQNYREVIQDQDGVENFQFRYSVRAHTGGYHNAEALTFSRSAATPLLCTLGAIPEPRKIGPTIELDPSRAVATCLKPADGDSSEGFILRFWETAGRSDPLTVRLKAFRGAILTDLLERDQKELQIINQFVKVKTNPYGFCCMRLLP